MLEQDQALLTQLERLLPHLEEQSLPRTYLQWLCRTTNTLEQNHVSAKALPSPIWAPKQPIDSPFLSIIMRTQGNRLEELEEVFLCLNGQSDLDFEIILVLHRVPEATTNTICDLIASQGDILQNRISVYSLEEGTRTAPLNLGASLAKGQYFTCLDDDDLVLSHWVETFRKGALAAPGKVIRCYGMIQKWEQHIDKKGTRQLRSVSGRISQYCQPYCLHVQLHENKTPISCIAIPTLCYQQFGLHYDETLTTTEDWDYFMQCGLLLGVYDTKEITFLYRIWMNATSSVSQHSKEEWDQNREKILSKLNDVPILTTREDFLAPSPYEVKITLKEIMRRIFRRCKRYAKFFLSLFKKGY